jgi:hypothetical protein
VLLLLRLLLPPPQRERVQWLQRIVDEESTQALQVPRAYVQASTKHATDYSRRVANDNARRAHTLTKISTAATEKSARRARESEFHRRWNHATKGEDTLSLPGEGDDAGADLDEITQLAAQVRAQAQRHAVDGALPLDDGDGDGGLGLSLMDELSLSNHSGPARETPARSTVFRKVRRQILPGACLPACLACPRVRGARVTMTWLSHAAGAGAAAACALQKRTESTLNAPAQTYYTVQQTVSEGDISMGASSELSFSGTAGDSGRLRTGGRHGRRGGRSRGSIGGGRASSEFGAMMLGASLSSLNTSLPRDHIEKLEAQRASIRRQ